jgi:hypothetical protein
LQPGSQAVPPPLELAARGQEIPICVVNFSNKFLRSELELRQCSLFVSAIGTRPVVLVDEVVAEVAHSFHLKEGSLQIHCSMLKEFLLLLPDAAVVERVYAEGRAFHGPRFSLQFKR